MSNALTDRSPQVIAAEINSIKDQTGKMLLYSAIEIGRRLTEAKSVVNHGEWLEWLEWLENSVSYSKSTAENLIRIFKEYGAKLPGDQDGNSNSQTFGNLSYSQAVILLGIPENERETFIVENEASNMSARDLKQAVQERDQALSEKTDLQKALDEQKGAVTKIASERDALKKHAISLKSVVNTNQATIQTLQKQLDTAKKGDVSAEKIAALENDLKAARIRLSANKVGFYCNSLSKQAKELLQEMNRLAPADPEAYQNYKAEIGKIAGTLTEGL